MERKKMIGLGLFLLLIGAWLTGVIEDILVGDTMLYVKMAMGYAGSALGIYLVERGVFRE